MSHVLTRSRPALLALAVLVAAGAGVAVAFDKSPEVKPPATPTAPSTPAAPAAPAMKPEDAAMMEMMMKLAAPGKPHAMIQKFAGTWKAEIKTWMDPTQKEPMRSSGVMTCRPLHGGRFLLGEYSGSFMNMPFEGTMLWGYNNAEQRFESTWMDSMGTMIMYSTGTSTDDNKSVTSTATFRMPGPDGKPMSIGQREKFTWTTDDSVTMEMWHTYKDQGPNAPEMRVMEITYTRQK